jgi:D-alanyl-D-alanine carboxypeptidase
VRWGAAVFAIAILLGACTAAPPPAARAPTPPEPSPASSLGAFPSLSSDPLADDVARNLQAVLDEVQPAYGPGVAAAVLVGGKGSWVGVAGTADGEVTLEPAAQFAIGSVTKTVIAAQVLLLVEVGAVDLDDPVDRYLPDAADLPTNDATVRQVLGMRSGIADYSESEGFMNSVCADLSRPTSQDALLALLAEEPHFEAGTRFSYSNANYHLAGLLIEHVTGRSVVEVLRDGILADAGLDRLVYQDDERPTPPLALPFVKYPSASPGPGPSDLLEAGEGFLPARCIASLAGPAGGMAADALTVAWWGYLLYGGSVLTTDSLHTMTTFEDGYGLGASDYRLRFGTFAVGHAGRIPGYEAQLVAFPDEAVVLAVLLNTDRQAEPLSIIAARLHAALASVKNAPE